MIVTVKLFAVARQLAQSDEVEVEIPPNATVADLRANLKEQYPSLNQLMGNVLFAVGTEYATDATRITPDLEIACIPPVSGG